MAESLDGQTFGKHTLERFYKDTGMDEAARDSDKFELLRHLIAQSSVMRACVIARIPESSRAEIGDILATASRQANDAIAQAFGVSLPDNTRDALYEAAETLAEYFLADESNQQGA